MKKFDLFIPEDYEPKLSLLETEQAIKDIQDFFQINLARSLKLVRVSAPLFVLPKSGLNDNLNGVERPVGFDVPTVDDTAEIVHSLAKWKRMALYRYGIEEGHGLYTDMNAIRRDEIVDNIHSIYVDQWDWEKVIKKEDRTEETLKSVVDKIYDVFKRTEDFVAEKFATVAKHLPDEIYYITSQELEDKYPELSPKERETAIAKDKKAVFIMKIGGVLKSGEKHDGRAPDYDDWELNGDILFYNPILESAYELSSMGIRVDEKALEKQLKLADCEDRKELKFHKLLLEGQLPYTIGGGIGQSRMCMYYLQKAHIGEVQASVWPTEMEELCEANNIKLL